MLLGTIPEQQFVLSLTINDFILKITIYKPCAVNMNSLFSLSVATTTTNKSTIKYTTLYNAGLVIINQSPALSMTKSAHFCIYGQSRTSIWPININDNRMYIKGCRGGNWYAFIKYQAKQVVEIDHECIMLVKLGAFVVQVSRMFFIWAITISDCLCRFSLLCMHLSLTHSRLS